MPRTAPNQALRRRIEQGIAIASPLLDLTLFVADRLSRLFDHGEPAAPPDAVRRDRRDAPRGISRRAGRTGPDH